MIFGKEIPLMYLIQRLDARTPVTTDDHLDQENTEEAMIIMD